MAKKTRPAPAAKPNEDAGEPTDRKPGLLLSGAKPAKGGFRPGAGRKPDAVREIERAALEVRRRDRATQKDVHIIEGCVSRLWAICQQTDDLSAAVKAATSLLDRACGKPRQSIDLEASGMGGVQILIVPPAGATGQLPAPPRTG